MISTRILCRPFVGRAEELEHLKLRRRQAGDGHGGLVLIGGEPGIGKSRLAGEFREWLNRRTSFVAASACREFAERPLRPILEILEKISEVRANDLVLSNKSDWLATIADAFERVAKRTTVVVIEDLHWADVDLVQTLLVLARRAANKRLLFVATYRDNELIPTHPLFKWFGQLLREPAVSSIRLPRFENRELDRLMAHAIEGSASLSPPLLHAVRDRADGNPLFAEELLRSAVDAQRAGLAATYFDAGVVAQRGALTATHARAAAAHAIALAATNRRTEARALLVRVLESLKMTFGMTLPFVALATLLPERVDELRPLLEAAAKTKGDRVSSALLALLEASVAAWRGDAPSAKARALDGARRFAAIGWPLLEARCLEIAGELAAARAIYRRCGAVGELRRLEFNSAAAEGESLGILTPRERELALQIASGKANRAVAESLSIGEKTVEKYLTSIYAKLGLSSRAQLAALVAASQRRADWITE